MAGRFCESTAAESHPPTSSPLVSMVVTVDQTPPWLLRWVRESTDGPYWRSGSLAPNYEAITCAIFHIGGWADGYSEAVLRIVEGLGPERAKGLLGPWSHSFPDEVEPGPAIDFRSSVPVDFCLEPATGRTIFVGSAMHAQAGPLCLHIALASKKTD